MGWSWETVPSMAGKVAVVTGGNGGLGFETARMLAEKGAEVVIAARNAAKAESARERILVATPGARVEIWALDLSNLAGVRAFCARWLGERGQIDLLVNNAGIMAIPRQLSADGFEMQLATNHLGHFALTLGVLPALRKSIGARVVNLSSGMHWMGTLKLDDLDGSKDYGPWTAYGQSKLCNLLFTLELDRRFKAENGSILALAAHPGYAATDLQGVAPKATGSKFGEAFFSLGNTLFAQSAEMGAMPTVRAATDPEVKGGEFFGPRVLSWFGDPAISLRSRASMDATAAAGLWAESERRTGASWSS